MGKCSLSINQQNEYLAHITTSIIQNLPALWYSPSRTVAVYQKERSIKNHQMLLHAASCTGSYLYTVSDSIQTSGEKLIQCFIMSTGLLYPRDGTLFATSVLDRTEYR